MVFSSNIFLFVFLPLFLAVYYLTPVKWRSQIILLGSYAFYAWWRIDFLALLFALTLWGYWVAKIIWVKQDTKAAKYWLWTGVTASLATLGYFKYWNFGVASMHAALTSIGVTPSFELTHIILPIGISFFVFHIVSFLIDVYRKDAPPPRSFFDFAAFIALFPHLVAGPVLRYKDLAWQFANRVHSFERFSEGCFRFMVGFSKKVLIADTVSPLADAAFQLDQPTMADAWIGGLAYAVQLYFDFSGYSDMAVGLALMMGFRFIENFDHPYISRSITEFWRRWHISLSTWLRDYLYIPLGGNRKGVARTYVNLFLTMLLGGLWHGANWTFVLWGAWHGAILAVERGLGIKGGDEVVPVAKRVAQTVLTMLFVLVGWILFRSPDMTTAIGFFAAMGGANGVAVSEAFGWQVGGMALATLFLSFGLIYVVPWVQFRMGLKTREQQVAAMQTPLFHIAAIIMFVFALMKLSAQSYTPFLYFQF